MRNSKKQMMLVMLSLLLMTYLTGCSRVTLYPMTNDHIQQVKKGEEYKAPRDGYFLSTDYMSKVLKAKVGGF